MFHSLRFRLIAVTAAIPLLAILGVAFFASRAAASEFDGIVGTRNASTNVVTISGSLLAPGDGSVAGIVGDGPQLCPFPFGPGAGSSLNTVFALPVGDAQRVNFVTREVDGVRESGTVLSDSGTAFAVYGAQPFTALYTGDQQRFLDGVNRNLLIGAIAAAFVSTAFAAFSARRLTGPLETLTGAARRLGSGDLKQRVDLKSRDEIGELAQAFNGMAQSLERAELLRRSMTSDVAHELRTPLQALSGYLDAAADGIVETDEALVQTLREETAVLVRLVEDLEQVALSDSGQLQLHRRMIAPAAVIARSADVARPRAAEHGITLVVEIPDALPEIEADPDRLAQVLRNLLENAIRHTPTGGTIALRTTLRQDALAIAVSDTGSGIAEEHLPFIFERFYRADSSRTRSTGGAGLGLAIVRQIVEAHGGTVSAMSAPGEGAIMTVALPLPAGR